MANKVTATLEGGEQFIRMIKRMEPAFAKKGFNRALRMGALPIWRGARARVSKDKGKLYRSISIRVVAAKGRKPPAAFIGPRITDFQTPGSSYYPFMVEYGTSKQAPQPYLRPSFSAHRRESVRIVIKQLEIFLMRAKKNGFT